MLWYEVLGFYNIPCNCIFLQQFPTQKWKIVDCVQVVILETKPASMHARSHTPALDLHCLYSSAYLLYLILEVLDTVPAVSELFRLLH